MPTYRLRDPEAQVYSRYFAAMDEDRRIELARNLLDTISKKVKVKEACRATSGLPQPARHPEQGLRRARPVRRSRVFALTIVDGVFNYAVRADVSLSRALDEKTTSYMEDARPAPRQPRQQRRSGLVLLGLPSVRQPGR